MRHPLRFVVRPSGKRYIDRKVIGGVDMVSSSSIEHARDVNRVGVISKTPLLYKGPLEEGYEVILHHNVFRDVYNQQGEFRHSNKRLFEDNFLVDDNLIFMYREEGGEWKCNLDYCFVKPCGRPLRGSLEYSNILPKGTPIGFTPESEYEFLVDGETLYKMRESDIAIVY